MKAIDAAIMLGIDVETAQAYMLTCDEVVESDEFVATLKDDTVHLAIKLHGLGGRKVLRECERVLSRWFERHAFLRAPVKIGNDAAIRVAQALGFHRYATTDTHVWLVREADHE